MKLGYQPIAPMDLKITTLRKPEDVEKIRHIWDEIQQREPFPVPNTDIKRYMTYIKASSDNVQPYIILMERNNLPVAMTIGRIEKRRFDLKLGYKTLFGASLRCLSIMYGGIMGQLSNDLCTALMGELMNALRRREADVVFLNHLRIDSPIYKLCTTVPHFITRSHFEPAQPHWQTYIPDTVEEFYSRISRSRKRRWNRNVRQLEKMSSSGIKVVCYRHLSDVHHLVNVAMQIEKPTYKDGLEVGFTDSALNWALLEQAAQDGRLKAYILYVGDEPCAFQIDLQYGKVQFAEYGSFDPRWSRGSPGIVILIKVLEQLCQEPDIRVMDFGFGDALFKKKFGTHCWLEKSVCIYAPRLRPILFNIAMSANQACCLVLHRALTYLKLDTWVKRNWRRMLRRRKQ